MNWVRLQPAFSTKVAPTIFGPLAVAERLRLKPHARH